MPLLRLRSDEQLVALFRAGYDEAFAAIYERYHKRLLAYARQMLPRRQDAEDALQDVFVRAYGGLRASDAELALRAWLFRVAHNRCIDELRRSASPPPEVMQLMRAAVPDLIAQAEQRECLRRLIADIRRLPDQQRSALLMRELAGMTYADLAGALGVTVPAVKSLLVRARLGLAGAAEARETDCALLLSSLFSSPSLFLLSRAIVRKHMRDCPACRGFRRQVRGISRQLAAIVPVGPVAALAHLIGLSGGAGSGATAGGATGATAGSAGVAATGGVAVSSAGGMIGAGHVATLIAAAVATAGGAVELQHTIAPAPVAHVRAAGHQQWGGASPTAGRDAALVPGAATHPLATLEGTSAGTQITTSAAASGSGAGAHGGSGATPPPAIVPPASPTGAAPVTGSGTTPSGTTSTGVSGAISGTSSTSAGEPTSSTAGSSAAPTTLTAPAEGTTPGASDSSPAASGSSSTGSAGTGSGSSSAADAGDAGGGPDSSSTSVSSQGPSSSSAGSGSGSGSAAGGTSSSGS